MVGRRKREKVDISEVCKLDTQNATDFQFFVKDVSLAVKQMKQKDLASQWYRFLTLAREPSELSPGDLSLVYFYQFVTV